MITKEKPIHKKNRKTSYVLENAKKRYYEKTDKYVKKMNYDINTAKLKESDCDYCGLKLRARFYYKGIRSAKHVVYNRNVNPDFIKLKKAKVVCSGCLYKMNADLKIEMAKDLLQKHGINVPE